MTSIIKTELEHLKHQASEIRAKIETLMSEPDNVVEIGSLNEQLDNLINLIGLNPNQLEGEKENEFNE